MLIRAIIHSTAEFWLAVAISVTSVGLVVVACGFVLWLIVQIKDALRGKLMKFLFAPTISRFDFLAVLAVAALVINVSYWCILALVPLSVPALIGRKLADG